MQDRTVLTEKPGGSAIDQLIVRVQNRVILGENEPELPIFVTNFVSPRLYLASRARGVQISTWQSAGISGYAGLEPLSYLVICGLLGLAEWRCLIGNPLLIEEDFNHSQPSDCLFSSRPSKPEYAQLFEQPHICGSCFDFYCCLGAENEILALNAFLARTHVA